MLAPAETEPQKPAVREQEERRRRCDPQALPVAQAALTAANADLAILFGSRARGDYEPQRSDIDLLLLQKKEPAKALKDAVAAIAESTAQAQYGWDVPVQLIWVDLPEFRQQRHYTNSLETSAVKDGIIMPRNQEEYGLTEYEDEAVETSYDWSNYEQRLRHAENHLSDFQFLAEHERADTSIGQHAQGALEHGMKALMAAHEAKYSPAHDIGTLLGNLRNKDPEMTEFRLPINPDVYTDYQGSHEYKPRREPELTTFPNYLEDTRAAVQTILDQAKKIREQKQTERKPNA